MPRSSRPRRAVSARGQVVARAHPGPRIGPAVEPHTSARGDRPGARGHRGPVAESRRGEGCPGGERSLGAWVRGRSSRSDTVVTRSIRLTRQAARRSGPAHVATAPARSRRAGHPDAASAGRAPRRPPAGGAQAPRRAARSAEPTLVPIAWSRNDSICCMRARSLAVFGAPHRRPHAESSARRDRGCCSDPRPSPGGEGPRPPGGGSGTSEAPASLPRAISVDREGGRTRVARASRTAQVGV